MIGLLPKVDLGQFAVIPAVGHDAMAGGSHSCQVVGLRRAGHRRKGRDDGGPRPRARELRQARRGWTEERLGQPDHVDDRRAFQGADLWARRAQDFPRLPGLALLQLMDGFQHSGAGSLDGFPPAGRCPRASSGPIPRPGVRGIPPVLGRAPPDDLSQDKASRRRTRQSPAFPAARAPVRPPARRAGPSGANKPHPAPSPLPPPPRAGCRSRKAAPAGARPNARNPAAAPTPDSKGPRPTRCGSTCNSALRWIIPASPPAQRRPAGPRRAPVARRRSRSRTSATLTASAPPARLSRSDSEERIRKSLITA